MEHEMFLKDELNPAGVMVFSMSVAFTSPMSYWWNSCL